MNADPLTLEQMAEVIKRMPFNTLVGIQVTATHDDGLTIGCELRPDLMNGAGVLHGGVTATLADAAVGLAVFRYFGGTRMAATVEMKVNYLRPIAEGYAAARARLVRIGSHLCVGQVDITDSAGALCGIAIVTNMLVDR